MSADETDSTKVDPACGKRGDRDFAQILQCLAAVAPHLATISGKNAEQETVRRADALQLWYRPFLRVVGLLGAMVLGLAGLAIWKDKADLSQTIVGYLLTYMGGIGTGHLLKGKSA